MIRNGLYSISTKLLDGVYGGATGISVLRNGQILDSLAKDSPGEPEVAAE